MNVPTVYRGSFAHRWNAATSGLQSCGGGAGRAPPGPSTAAAEERRGGEGRVGRGESGMLLLGWDCSSSGWGTPQQRDPKSSRHRLRWAVSQDVPWASDDPDLCFPCSGAPSHCSPSSSFVITLFKKTGGQDVPWSTEIWQGRTGHCSSANNYPPSTLTAAAAKETLHQEWEVLSKWKCFIDLVT